MAGAIGIGVDVGGTKILAVAVDGEGTLLDEVQIPSPSHVDRLAATMTSVIVEFAERASRDAPLTLGLALPGLVDAEGFLHSAPNLGAPNVDIDLHRVLASPILSALGGRAGDRASLENDATAAAFGEARIGAAHGRKDVFVVSLGTGIGAGLIADGALVRGARRYAGEIGHMVIDPDGPECTCGRQGCWEQFASGLALGRLATRNGAVGIVAGLAAGHEVRGEDVVEAVRRGDPEARAVVQEYAGYIAIGLVNATEILDPEVIVLGGGLITASDVVLGPTRDEFERRSRPALDRHGSDLIPATLGSRAAAIGMALLSIEERRS